MTDTEESVANVEATGRPTVAVDGTPMRADMAVRLQRVVVDNDAHLPGMFELTFLDVDGKSLREARISMGSEITITGAGPAGEALTLLTGEVTGLEAQIRGMTQRTIVRGYTAEHRLQRARRSRSFVNVTDADVARRIATEAGLTVRDVRCSGFTHSYLAQVNQTDWEFLDARARETGCEFGVVAGEFHFHPSGGGLAAKEVAIRYPDDLISFRPRITAGNLTPDVEVRVWDPLARKAVAENVSMVSGGEHSPRSLGQRFTSTGRPGALGGLGRVGSALASGDLGGVASGLSGLGGAGGAGGAGSALGGMLGSPVGYLGPRPSATANIRSDRPFARASAMPTAGPTVAGAFGTAAGSTFAEAEGEVKGNAAVQPGAVLTISGVQAEFAGTWRVSRARHVFDDLEFGYRVIFSAHGRQDRTMVGLASRATAPGADRARMSGVVCGVVSDCADPLAKGRMKLTLPWLSPDFETDWAPNIQFVAGQKTGAMFLPEVGDEVLVAFEFGDIRRPYVLGGMMNNLTQWDVSASGPLQAGGEFVGGIVDSILNEDANIFTTLADTFNAQMAMGTGLAKKVVGNVAGTAGFATGGLVDTSAAGDTYGELADANLAMYTDATNTVADGLSGIGGGGGSAAGSVVAPGMVSEVHHRGFVSSTGNSLLFYDVPLPMGMAAGTGASGTGTTEDQSGSADTGTTNGTGGGTGKGAGSGAAGAGLGTPAIGSSVRLGSQNGEVSVTVDQVNAGVSINAAMVPGTSVNPMPSVSLSADNGLLYLSAGQAGAAMINGGAGMVISATGTITLSAENVNVVGLLTVNGIPVPI
ncbi:phage baseplate assembly protein V [Actinophytocola algeriensis]|uniref:Phage protein D n=1 Tax=Actinophytocola algeriensis TaxID=1768010 RepID=A0A7W7Q4R0_9PSEU|nr:phage baseplate assembly protein V [Actinophytocola algeriensis]MBB4907040.1 phage protein D [Actinophytocola algeriensis]MBE1478523.1 phage protein D [Actinophytocola algeriensis]